MPETTGAPESAGNRQRTGAGCRCRWALTAAALGLLLALGAGCRKARDASPASLARLSLAEIEARAGREPADPSLQLELGVRYAEAGRDEDAERALRRSLSARDSARARTALGLVLRRRGAAREALPHLEAATRLDPSFAPAYRELARACYLLKNQRRALPALERYLQLAPGDAEAHYRLGVLYTNTGRLDRAEASYENAARLDGGRPASLLALGRCLLNRQPTPERLRRAEECFARALQQEPRGVDLCYYLGLAQLRQGRLPQAAATLERAVRLDPGYPLAHLALGQTYLRLGKPQRARKHLAAFERLQPGRAAAAGGPP